MLLAPIGNPEPKGLHPSGHLHFSSHGGTQTVKMQFATDAKKNKRKHLRQVREDANLPFGAGVQYIVLFHIPPYTPEMNPIEQIWKEIRKRGFRNEVFATLEKVVDRLCDTICSLTPNTIFSITGRDWIIKAFN